MTTLRAPHAARNTWTLVLVAASALGLSTALTATGCDDTRPNLMPTGGGGAGGSSNTGGTTTTTTQDQAEILFNGLVDEMMTACGPCHDAGGIADTPFLKDPRYESITSWPGIVTKDIAESKLLTHSVTGGGHGGTNLDSASLKDTLFPKVKAWLAESQRNVALASFASLVVEAKHEVCPIAGAHGRKVTSSPPGRRTCHRVADSGQTNEYQLCHQFIE